MNFSIEHSSCPRLRHKEHPEKKLALNIFHQNLYRRAAHLNSEIRLAIGNFAVFQSKLSAKASDYEQCMKSISFTEPVSIPAGLLSDQT